MPSRFAIATQMIACLFLAGCSKSPTYEVKGPHAKDVATIIAATDAGNLGQLKNLISGVKYTEGPFGEPATTRMFAVSDIPPSDAGACKLARIVGNGKVVDAHWDCECCDMALDRQFVFKDGKLVEVRNIFAILV